MFNDRIIVVTREPATADAVAGALLRDDRGLHPSICGDLLEMQASLERAAARAVLVDIDPDPEAMLADLMSLTARFGETRFVILAREQCPDHLLKAMQAGARSFLDKPRIGDDLPSVLASVCPPDVPINGARREAEGAVVSVIGAGGGVGATTMAINVANELRLLAAEPTLLIDLDDRAGSIGGILALHADYGIADVLDGGERLDDQLIRSSAVEHDEHFDVLVSPATVHPLDPAPLNTAALGRALARAREAYRYVVVDAPRPRLDLAEALVRASTRTFVLFEMNVEDIRLVKAMLGALEHRGLGRDALTPLAMRHRPRRDAISLEEAARAIGAVRVESIANDYAGAVMSINYGKTLAETAPRGELRRDIQKLATEVYERTTCGLT